MSSLVIYILLLCLHASPGWSFHRSSLRLRNRYNVVKMISEVAVTEEEWARTFELVKDNIFLPSTPQSLSILSKQIEAANPNSREFQILKLSRQNLLAKLLESDRKQYLEIVSQYGERIPRSELPNRQEVALPASVINAAPSNPSILLSGDVITVADCKLPNITFSESILDKFLLRLFRKYVQEEVKFISPTKGIRGLLEEGRQYMLGPEGSMENQHRFVRVVLGRTLTPILPPFFRVFMSGIVPCKENNDPTWLVQLTDNIRSSLPESLQDKFAPGRQFGPWFYAPFLTSFVTPLFLNFLVGPATINRRKDGKLGGMVVEKCKFLQESGCKGMTMIYSIFFCFAVSFVITTIFLGLCMHQCKLPAQQFFADTLGLPLTVSPNFETQECQWSFGEVPVAPADDPNFPRGCLASCPSRGVQKEQVCDGYRG